MTTTSPSALGALLLLLAVTVTATRDPRVRQAAVDDDGLFALPKDLRVGAGVSAFQTEGAWDADGKAESMLDRLFHTQEYVFNASHNVSADSYHRFREDVAAAKALKLQMYRFSISWPRLLPTSDPAHPNEAGRLYYHSLLDEIVSNGMEPMVTLYHFDHPMAVQDEFGGWQDRRMIEKFVQYADYVFREYGSKVKMWTTVNEANIFCTYYKMRMTEANLINPDDWDVFRCLHHTILAHGRTYRLYREKYHAQQQGMVSWTPLVVMGEPETDTVADRHATELYNQATQGIIMHPLVYGDYPEALKLRKGGALYNFTEEEKAMLKGSADFMGLNVYYSLTIRHSVTPSTFVPFMQVLYEGLDVYIVPPNTTDELAGMALIMPQAMEEALTWIWLQYKLPMVIGENGKSDSVSDGVGLHDHERAAYFSAYLRTLVSTVKKYEGMKVLAYMAWSLVDCFEWGAGYTRLFGLASVDFETGSLNRTLRDSSSFFQELARTRAVPYVPSEPATPATPAPSSAAAALPSALVVMAMALLGAAGSPF